MPKTHDTVSADIDIAADPEAVYALITDLDVMSDLAAEAMSHKWTKGQTPTAGAQFTGRNKNGKHAWSTTCTVTDARPGTTFEFEVKSLVVPIARWRYDIAPTEGGCKVTESTLDLRPGWFKPIGGWATGVKDRATVNLEHINQTLARLKERAEAA